MKNIAGFKNLRKLNLSFTPITGATLNQLTGLKELQQLSLSGTKVQARHLKALAALPKLSRLYIWNTNITSEELNSVQKQLKNATVETGFNGDTVVIKLTAPIIENEEQVVLKHAPLQLKHYINGVEIRYTTDGSEPDSLTSPVYKNDVTIDKAITVKAKAFKPGWISSDVVERNFFKAGFKPDSIDLLHPPDPQYKGAPALLGDLQKGEQNTRDGKWLGYRIQPLEALLYFKQPATVSSITVSSLIDIDGYIMPPQKIEVWGGADASKLQLLKQLAPKQPLKVKPGFMEGYELKFKPLEAAVLKVVVTPVGKLPAWHRGKGDRGWIFVDEIFVN